MFLLPIVLLPAIRSYWRISNLGFHEATVHRSPGRLRLDMSVGLGEFNEDEEREPPRNVFVVGLRLL